MSIQCSRCITGCNDAEWHWLKTGPSQTGQLPGRIKSELCDLSGLRIDLISRLLSLSRLYSGILHSLSLSLSRGGGFIRIFRAPREFEVLHRLGLGFRVIPPKTTLHFWTPYKPIRVSRSICLLRHGYFLHWHSCAATSPQSYSLSHNPCQF